MAEYVNLFGEPVSIPEASIPTTGAPKKRKETRPQGYAARPGSGPAGETCKSCRHLERVHYAKTYRKCGLNKANWTHGPGSDVLAGSPACQLWEAKAKPQRSATKPVVKGVRDNG